MLVKSRGDPVYPAGIPFLVSPTRCGLLYTKTEQICLSVATWPIICIVTPSMAARVTGSGCDPSIRTTAKIQKKLNR